MLLCISFSVVNAQWEWNNPYPQPNDLNDVQFIDSQTGWAVGDLGTIIITTNGGDTWDVKQSNLSRNLNKVWFVDQYTGWAVGDSGYIIQTSDGGNTWNPQSCDTTFDLTDVHFIDDSIGWVAGRGEWSSGLWQYKGTIIHTNDGGENWIPQLIDTTIRLEGIHFVNDTLGWAVGLRFNPDTTQWPPPFRGLILHTINGGTSWEVQNSDYNEVFYDVFFLDDQCGWTVGYDIIFHTDNGGNSWIEQFNDDAVIRSVVFTDSETGWAVGNNHDAYPNCPYLFRTYDGGNNWENESYYLPLCQFRGVSFSDENNGLIVGSLGTIRHTTNGGNTFESQSGVHCPGPLLDVFFIDQYTGWAVGEYWGYPWNGIIMLTSDGGENWSYQDWTSAGGPRDIFFTDHNNGWLTVSGYGSSSIKHTINGGITWYDQYSSNDYTFYDIYFVDVNNGWAVGYDGYGSVKENILHTSDGGNSWEAQDAGTDTGLEGVYFLDLNEGWSVGWGGTLLHTSNGGEIWEMQNSGITDDLKGVYFYDRYFGWVFGCNFIIHTTDGGLTWETQFADTIDCLRGMSFTDENRGWLVGDDGFLLYTIDGGLSWNELNIGITGRDYHSVYFTDPDDGWITGDNGTILHIDNGTTVGIDNHTIPFISQMEIDISSNPFTTSTTLSYKLNQPETVSISIFDQKGQLVYQIEKHQTQGKNHITLNAERLTSGVYFYFLTAGNQTSTGKLVVVR